MSRIKDYNIMDIEAMDDERLEKSESGKIQVTRVYIKSEIDKEIAKMKGKLVEQTTLRVWAELQLRHNKYKRCLSIISYLNIRIASSFLTSPEYTDWLTKWKVRWLKIAEQFKEAK